MSRLATQYTKFKHLLIGKPLDNARIHDEKYSVFWGLPIMASDAISSIAYASEEILLVLVPVIGTFSYGSLGWISAVIIMLLFILTFSYRQTIDAYPQGGGAYIVASDNLGVYAGVTAGAALAVDYVLTVAVSVSSGVAALTSAFPLLRNGTILLCLFFLGILVVGNLRGIRDSARIFSFPPYAFIVAILGMIVYGVVKIKFSGFLPYEPQLPVARLDQFSMIFLLLAAFSNGCTALTGVEAVSNATTHFKAPATKNAKNVLLLLALFVFLMFGGTSLLANLYHVVPNAHQTVLSQIAEEIFGRGIIYYLIQGLTMLILVMAANTAYTGFPALVAMVAQDGFAPRQLCMRGDRLSYSNGIKLLTVIAAILIIVFRGNTSALIPLYAIGVFVSFTLSQSGMFIRWLKIHGEHWISKAAINGLGAVMTAIVVSIIAVTKFTHGAWIVIIVIPLLVSVMLVVKRHYAAVAMQLRMPDEELASINVDKEVYRNRVIVPISSINRSSVRALRYARTISDNVVAFSVTIDEKGEAQIRRQYNLLKCEVPLIVRYSPYRKVVEPLINFIESTEYNYKKGDMITVILPQFAVHAWWHGFLHNHSRVYIERQLLKHKHIVVATMPLQLKQDKLVLGC